MLNLLIFWLAVILVALGKSDDDAYSIADWRSGSLCKRASTLHCRTSAVTSQQSRSSRNHLAQFGNARGRSWTGITQCHCMNHDMGLKLENGSEPLVMTCESEHAFSLIVHHNDTMVKRNSPFLCGLNLAAYEQDL
jgi:hypothetical protein